MAPSTPQSVEVVYLPPDDPRFSAVLDLAAAVLAQDRYLIADFPHAQESYVLAAFRHGRPVGFLRVLIQVIGAEEGRPPVLHHGTPLTEAFVEAFGVDPAGRREGIGSALQAHAADMARASGCHQMRSRSPVTSVENYALKVDAGYAVNPSEQNDSYYFLLRL